MRVCVALVVASLSLSAHAVPDAAALAKTHYERGFSAYALQKYPEAAEEYEKAFELRPDPALLYNAAQAHRLAGNKKRALSLYESYLRMFEKPPRRVEVTRVMGELRAAIAADERSAIAPPNDVVRGDTMTERPVIAPRPNDVTVEPAPRVDLVRAAPPKPLTKRGWFWGVMAATGVVVIGGVVVGVVLGTSSTHYPQASGGAVVVN